MQARHGGKLLPLTRFGKDDAEITQGAMVSNKLLAGALQFIKDKQAVKDVEKLSRARGRSDPVSRSRAPVPAPLDSVGLHAQGVDSAGAMNKHRHQATRTDASAHGKSATQTLKFL